MSLVSYDYSDSENEKSDTDDNNEPENNTGKVLLPEINEEKNTKLFAQLPTPKYISHALIEEVYDEFLKKTALKLETENKPKTVKISVPSMSDFSETDIDEVPKKIFKPSTNSDTTGLFSVLPPPKAVKISSTKFVPNSITKKPIPAPKTIKPIETITKEEDGDINDDAKQNTSSFFFTSIFDTISDTKTPPEPLNPIINVDCARNVQEADLKTNRYFADMINNTTNVIPIEESASKAEVDLVEEAYTQLVGKSRKAKGKDNKKRELEIIDINATDIMPDPRDWMTKSLTQEKHVVATKKGDEPSMQQRRKHQITYLAYQAKLNEQELKNQWAVNRTSRKQTQAKYGF